MIKIQGLVRTLFCFHSAEALQRSACSVMVKTTMEKFPERSLGLSASAGMPKSLICMDLPWNSESHSALNSFPQCLGDPACRQADCYSRPWLTHELLFHFQRAAFQRRIWRWIIAVILMVNFGPGVSLPALLNAGNIATFLVAVSLISWDHSIE